nr:GTPase [Allomuricauda sp.]
MEPKLVFVYNADSGTRNAILDSMHKIFSPQTYQCSLCDITFGLVSENGIWKRFREQSDLNMKFLHRDEFAEKYKDLNLTGISFPVVLSELGNTLNVLISTDELNQLKDAGELIALIISRTEK